ncbi:MAG TPA: hypothetical protein VH306_11475 [Gaiellaceae bacterium]|jgi:hypothetical protein
MEPLIGSGRGAPATGARTSGEALGWISSVVFALSSFMSWYTADFENLGVSVTGWHTGALGKLVFFLGLAAVVLLVLRQTGTALPPTLPFGMVLLGIGALGTIIVLVRILSIPEDFAGFGRSIGIWVSLISALGISVAGFLRGAEDV